LRFKAWLLVGLLLVSGLLLAACGKKEGSAGEAVRVSMGNMLFAPKEVKVKVGTTVTWVNDDLVDHSVQNSALGFQSPELSKSGTFSYTFAKAGTFDVICATPGHKDAGMVMKVIVER
jgi:plastocyanin